MKIGIPKELKNNESRVSMVPSGVMELKAQGHQVFIEKDAGIGSGFTNEEYTQLGAQLLPTHEEIFQVADMIVKVKEPIEEEYKLIRKGQIIFTYFHFAASKYLTQAMQEREAVCISYETIQLENGSLPLLIPMSEIAGRLAVHQGATYLKSYMGGKGILLGGVAGVDKGKVMILGGGTVGTEAAKMAAGLGAEVIVLDINLPRLRYLEDVMPKNVRTLFCDKYRITRLLPEQDLVIGAVLIPGGKAPYLIEKEMISSMQKGSVIVDVAVDQGGCIATCKPTTHQDPIFIIDGVIHYCVANMPGIVPKTSTMALTNVTFPFVLKIANKGWKKSLQDHKELQKGANVIHGDIVYPDIATCFDMPVVSLEKYL